MIDTFLGNRRERSRILVKGGVGVESGPLEVAVRGAGHAAAGMTRWGTFSGTMAASLPYYLQALSVVLGTAAMTSLVSQHFKQPPIFGHLLAGMLLGPHVPWTMIAGPGGAALTHAMSEFGVILLMFSIGIEFNLRKIARIGPSTGMTALFVVGLMVSAGYLLGRAFAWTRVESLFVGACVAISSTMFVAKAFEDQHLRGEFTAVTTAILVFEDLIAILLLAVLTAIASGSGLSAGEFALTLGKLLGFLIVVLTAGLLVVPRFLRRVVGQHRAESTLIAGIAICFITTALTSAAGYSVALGAFLAGLLVAESGEGTSVEHVIRPLRDIFGALFFISVGISIDPSQIAAHWLPVLAFTALVLVGKVAGVSLGAFLFGQGVQTSVRAGMSLAQIGEFSFIIAGLGIASGVTGEFIFPVVVGVSLLTSVITPWMVRRSHGAAAGFEARLPAKLRLLVALYGAWIKRLWSAPPASASSRLRRGALSRGRRGVAGRRARRVERGPGRDRRRPLSPLRAARSAGGWRLDRSDAAVRRPLFRRRTPAQRGTRPHPRRRDPPASQGRHRGGRASAVARADRRDRAGSPHRHRPAAGAPLAALRPSPFGPAHPGLRARPPRPQGLAEHHHAGSTRTPAPN
ncbi:cation:proton antiporter [Nannocystis pusilla]|uniref:Cation:proton antiporter n=1 Tax=Nannocystis pusilla TaxID=889268 RepID=A0A9X3J400_9BACT|nr:cation:proton antiporter [Nannocystis pusilla]MCY1013364.1 cation:proton antiporter [Nannocystis pusilla]